MTLHHPPLRSADHVMRLTQMGAMFPTRLSFLRQVTRRLIDEKCEVTRQHCTWDEQGFGTAVYQLTFGAHPYALCAITSPLSDENRTDRVIAEAWDAAFVLFDGHPTPEDIAEIEANAPLQEAGRFNGKALVLSRANKSVRLFQSVVTALREDRPLPMADLHRVGYMMRTTAVYGNGKFGIADRPDFANRPGMSGPFAAEMLTVWLIRHFTHDLVEHLAGKPLPKKVKKMLGIGNATGLGMAPFLVSHPNLLNAWMTCREEAVARVKAAPMTHDIAQRLMTLSRRVGQHLLEWNVADAQAQADIVALRRDWAQMMQGVTQEQLLTSGIAPLLERSAYVSTGLEELTVAWAIEGFGDLTDDLTACMATPAQPQLDRDMPCETVAQLIADHWPDCLATDFEDKSETGQFWYVSAAKLEPRLGQRQSDPGADLESPLDISRRMQSLRDDLNGQAGPIWQFLLTHPHHRFAVERVQTLAKNPYSEIRCNLIAATTAPIDMLRCKLSFFGATKFDPKSKLWTRITLGQGAPLAEEIADGTAKDDWWLAVNAP